MISEKELNSYRLTSMEEPTDEMLAQIMHEEAVLYRKENEDAQKRVIDMIKEACNYSVPSGMAYSNFILIKNHRKSLHVWK